MTELFQTFLLLSAVGSLMTIILLAVKKFTGKYFPPVWQYALWIGVLLLMTVPISIKIPYDVQTVIEKTAGSILSSSPMETPENTAVLSEYEGGGRKEGSTKENGTNENGTDVTYMDGTGIEETSTAEIGTFVFPWWEMLTLVWILGVIVSLGYRMTVYGMFIRHIHSTGEPVKLDVRLPKRLRVYKIKEAVSPMVTGIIQPVLILPQEALTNERLNYVLCHELIHYRRGDLIWRWLAVLAMSVHWFNPVVYMAVSQMQEACEISCDYSVVRIMGQEKRDDYMRVILELLTAALAKRQILTTQMASGKKQLQRRFTMIRNQRVLSKRMIFLSICVGILFLGTAWLTGCALQEAYVQEEPDIELDEDIEIAEEIEGLAEEGALLFVGTDSNGRADTIFTYFAEEEKAYIYSITRDTETADGQKISGLLMQEKGDTKLIQAVSEITAQPVADYVRMDLNAVETIIDTLEGVTFDIPQNMDYEDYAQGLSIHLKAGEQMLSGKDALGLLRYREGYPDKDLSRIEIQQAFLREMFMQKCDPAYLKDIPEILKITKGHVFTNLTVADIAEYGQELYDLRKNDADALELHILQ